jgi:hypothetical protein
LDRSHAQWELNRDYPADVTRLGNASYVSSALLAGDAKGVVPLGMAFFKKLIALSR